MCSPSFRSRPLSSTATYTLSLHDALPIYICDALFLCSFGDHFSKVCCSLNIVGLLKLCLHIFLKSGSGNKSISNSIDRKSTRLNSSHVSISYAVFCLKKKKTRTSLSPRAG